MLTLKFVLEFSQEILKLECRNLVYTWTMSCCIVGLRIGLLALIFPFIALTLLFIIIYLSSFLCVCI